MEFWQSLLCDGCQISHRVFGDLYPYGRGQRRGRQGQGGAGLKNIKMALMPLIHSKNGKLLARYVFCLEVQQHMFLKLAWRALYWVIMICYHQICMESWVTLFLPVNTISYTIALPSNCWKVSNCLIMPLIVLNCTLCVSKIHCFKLIVILKDT